MKKINSKITALFAAAILGVTAGFAGAQTAVSETTTTTTTNNAGVISEISPDAIVIRSETSTTPMRYSYSKTTTYVDEAGNPVSMEVVKSGVPVTVYYTSEGDRMVASKVVVRKAAPALEHRETTTTTTTEED